MYGRIPEKIPALPFPFIKIFSKINTNLKRNGILMS
jgi:hypothetical protein